jgi:hypothetical protein
MERHGIDGRRLLARHGAGDWGDIDPEDVAISEEALRCGGRLLSAYGAKTDSDDATIWVITEADRSGKQAMCLIRVGGGEDVVVAVESGRARLRPMPPPRRRCRS